MASQPTSLPKTGVTQQYRLWEEIPRWAVLVLELCWLVPWFQLATLAAQDVPPVRIGLVFGLVAGLGQLLFRAVFRFRIKDKIRRAVIAGYVALAAVCSLQVILLEYHRTMSLWELYNQPLDEMTDFRELIPPEVMIVLFVLIMVQRGFFLARNWGGANTVLRSIQLGILMLVAYGIVDNQNAQFVIQVNLYVFMVTAIFAMITARIGSIANRRGGRGVKFDRRWLGSIISSTMILAGIAAAVAVVSSNLVEQVNQLLKFIFYTAFLFVATPFFTLLSRIFPSFEAIAQAVSSAQPQTVLPEGDPGEPVPPLGEELTDVAVNGVELLLQLRFILFAIVIVGGLFVLIRMAGNWRDRRAADGEDEHHSLLEGQNLLQFLWDLLRNKVIQTTSGLTSRAGMSRRDRARAAERIRRIYSDFMDLCDELGLMRTASQTPQEFLPAAIQLLPGAQTEIQLITESYQRIRYGEYPEGREEVEVVERSWTVVHEQGESLRKQLRSLNSNKS